MKTALALIWTALSIFGWFLVVWWAQFPLRYSAEVIAIVKPHAPASLLPYAIITTVIAALAWRRAFRSALR
jgi:hypothetical protein